MNVSLPAPFKRFHIQGVSILGLLICGALLSFEAFNFSTTLFALRDLLGDLKFIGITWAAILSLAFCGMDFAGIARLFTPRGKTETIKETWYLFTAWLLAGGINAMLTWWGVSLAVVNHETLGNAVVQRETLLQVVPVFVAILVWLIRVLIIGSFSMSSEHIFQTTAPTEQKRTATVVHPAAGINGGIRPIAHHSRPSETGAPLAAANRQNGVPSNSGIFPPR